MSVVTSISDSERVPRGRLMTTLVQPGFQASYAITGLRVWMGTEDLDAKYANFELGL